MDGDQTVRIVAILGGLVLVASSLAVRRLPARALIWMALAWVALFVLGALVIRFTGIVA